MLTEDGRKFPEASASLEQWLDVVDRGVLHSLVKHILEDHQVVKAASYYVGMFQVSGTILFWSFPRTRCGQVKEENKVALTKLEVSSSLVQCLEGLATDVGLRHGHLPGDGLCALSNGLHVFTERHRFLWDSGEMDTDRTTSVDFIGGEVADGVRCGVVDVRDKGADLRKTSLVCLRHGAEDETHRLVNPLDSCVFCWMVRDAHAEMLNTP